MVSSPVISVRDLGVHFEERGAHCSRPLSSVDSGGTLSSQALLLRSEARNDRRIAVPVWHYGRGTGVGLADFLSPRPPASRPPLSCTTSSAGLGIIRF
jgi:hypothetical protein